MSKNNINSSKFEPDSEDNISLDKVLSTPILLAKEDDTNKKAPNIPFWTNNPNVLLQVPYLLEFFPVEGMTYEQKLNSITRTVMLFTIVIFVFTQSLRALLMGIVTIGAICLFYSYHEQEKQKIESKKEVKVNPTVEGFSGPAAGYIASTGQPLPTDVFDTPDSSNPFSNVLLTDYEYNPDKKPAPRANNQSIVDQVKQTIADQHADQPDLASRIFNDLGEQLYLEQSLRPFNSNPATTIPNDQGAFAEFCYGSMISCKEGNKFACARNMSHYTNY